MLKTKKIADLAIILAFAMIANLISWTIPFFGRFSLVYTMAYIAGIFFGPLIGLCITMLGDLIPALIFPQGGAWMPLITIGTGLISFIVGLANKYIRLNFQWRLIIGAIAAYILCTAIIIPLGELPLFHVMKYQTARLLGKILGIESPFIMISLSKIVTQPLWITINLLIVITLCLRLQKIIDKRYGNVINKKIEHEKIADPVVT